MNQNNGSLVSVFQNSDYTEFNNLIIDSNNDDLYFFAYNSSNKAIIVKQRLKTGMVNASADLFTTQSLQL
jgi:hypothetical protein